VLCGRKLFILRASAPLRFKTIMTLIIQQRTSPDDPLAVFIMGPTATGKTDLAIALAGELPLDIISVDSAMVYRGMDIGSAKPDAKILAASPHRLIDICDPAEAYSAGRFREEALAEMGQISSANRIPLLVGGTMLYFRALQQGIAELPGADADIRQQLDDEASTRGWDYMHRRLQKIDPESAKRIHPNDPQRIQRALEVFEISGKTLTEFWRDQGTDELPYRSVKIALMPPDRVDLRKLIEQRFDAMLDAGLVEEVEDLYRRTDLTAELPAIRAVGYRQVWAMLAGEYDYKTMREKAIIATAQLAKRQMTWLRKEPECNFIEPESVKLLNLLKNLRFLL
jgi:tRNA dimethylallyltransferase